MAIDFATLDELADAAIAAYGGEDLSTGGWIALLPYDPVSSSGNFNYHIPADLSSVLSFDSEGFLNYRSFVNAIDLQVIPFFKIINGEKVVVIAFRGTQEALDFLTDFDIAIPSILYPALEVITPFFEAVRDYAQSIDASLYTAGHSLGGALAELLFAQNQADFAGGLGMGSPGYGPTDGGFANSTNFVHIAHQNDLISGLLDGSHVAPTIIIDNRNFGAPAFGWGPHGSATYQADISNISASPAFQSFNIDAIADGSRIYIANSGYPFTMSIASAQFIYPFAAPYVGFIGSPHGDSIDGSGATTDLRIDGSGGVDTIQGGGGNDTIYGGNDFSVIYGGGGADLLIGASYADDIRGQDGNDTIEAGGGENELYGGIGNDSITAGSGWDSIRGEADNDTLIGGGGSDTIYGDEGSDQIAGGTGGDILRGGSGADTFVYQLAELGLGSDIIEDFNQGNSGSFDALEGDTLDLRSLITPAGIVQPEGNLVRFVARTDGSGLDLLVDPDGTGGDYHEISVAFLKGLSSGAGLNVLTGAGGTAPTAIAAVSAPGSYTISPSSRVVNEGTGTITFTITRPHTANAETVYVSTTINRGSLNDEDYDGWLNEPVTFAAGDATETVTITINDDGEDETAEQFGLIIQSSPSQPASQFLASASFTIIDDDDGPGGEFTEGSDTVWLDPPPYAGAWLDGLGGNDTAVLDFRSLTSGFTVYRSGGTLYANTGGGNPLSLVNVENFVVLGSNEYDSIDLGQGGVILARGGNDQVWGGSGVDVIDAGSGDDTIHNIGIGDVVEGGSGTDRLYFDVSSSSDDFTINLATGQGAGGVWTGIEHVSGTLGSGDDTVIAGMQLEGLQGGGGNDHIELDYSGALPDGRSATSVSINLTNFYSEYVYLSDSTHSEFWLSSFESSRILATSGDDYVEGGNGGNFISGLGGNDQLYGGNSDDTLLGGDGNDYIDGRYGADSLNGGEGDDYFSDVGEGDIVDGGEGIDRLYFNLSASTTSHTINILTGVGAGASWTGIEFITGTLGSGDDTVVAGIQLESLYGGFGNDHIELDYSGTLPDGRSAIYLSLSLRDNNNEYVQLNDLSTYPYFQIVGFESSRIIATSSDDYVEGGDAGNFISGLGGSDQLYGGSGSDTLLGGNGDDYLRGRDGADSLDGGDGDDYFDDVGEGDTVHGGAGMDRLTFSLSASTTSHVINTLTGVGAGASWTGIEFVTGTLGSGDDAVIAGMQLEGLDGGAGDDTLTADYSGTTPEGEALASLNISYNSYWGTVSGVAYRPGGVDYYSFTLRNMDNLRLTGTAGDDYFFLYGTGGNHAIHGGGGNDTIFGGSGAETLNGGAGDDWFYFVGPGDEVDGGAGIDRLSFTLSDETANLTLNLLTGESAGASWAGIEFITGTLGSGNDAVIAGMQLEGLDGGAGNDTLTADYSGTTPEGEALASLNISYNSFWGTVSGVAYRPGGVDYYSFTLRNMDNLRLTGTVGDDYFYLYGTGGNHAIHGGGGNDTIFGGSGAETLTGGAGDDWLYFVGPGDEVDGGAGIDRLSFTLSDETADLTLNLLTGESAGASWAGIEFITGTLGSGNDAVIAGMQLDNLDGGAGDDTLTADYSGTTPEGEALTSVSIGYNSYWGTVSGVAYRPGGGDYSFTLRSMDNLRLTGTAGDDYFFLYGTGGNHAIHSGGGSDTFHGGTGNDSIDGGAGNDTACFTGYRADYLITYLGNGAYRIADTRVGAPDGEDTVSGVEALQFADMVLVSPFLPAFNLAGGAGADSLVGAGGDDTISGAGGDDTLLGEDGADSLSGGSGNDTVQGGGGNDTIDGAAGNDSLDGGAGDDTILVGAGSGTDTIAGGPGQDRIVATAANIAISVSQLSGIEEVDGAGHAGVRIAGTAGAETLDFSAANLIGISAIDGGNGADTIIGSAGNDTIIGSFGNDSLDGGDGDDTFLIGTASGTDTFLGGAGHDRIMATAANAVIGIGQASGIEAIDGGGFANVRIGGTPSSDLMDLSATALAGIAAIDGGNGNDTITGPAAAVSINGGNGHDSLLGGSGNDTLDGGIGNDRIDGGSGANSLIGGEGNDAYIVRSTGDRVVEAADGGIDSVETDLALYSLATLTQVENLAYTGAGNATLSGNSLSNRLTGGGGSDSLGGGSGNDTLAGGDGNDTLNGSFGNDSLDGGSGDDTFLIGAASGIDSFSGGTGHDRILVTAANAVIGVAQLAGIEAIDGGGLANVRIVATAASELLDFSGVALTGIAAIEGGNGKDTIVGSTGADTIVGGYGNDSMDGGEGDDIFLIGTASGTDTFIGGAGHDRIVATAANATITLGLMSGVEAIDGGGLANVRILATAASELLDFSGLALTGIAAIHGGNGKDTIVGSAGDDTIIGGNGQDVMTGGGGADSFVFTTTAESSRSTPDTIADFVLGMDRIDLSAIDGDGTSGTADAFAWIGAGAFTGTAGELRYALSGGNTVIQGDTNGDGVADIQIVLAGTFSLDAGAFAL